MIDAPRTGQAGEGDGIQGEKRRKAARLILWFLTLGLLVSFGLLADSVYHFATQPGALTALKLIPNLGCAIMFTGWLRQARETIRNNGIEPHHRWLGIGPLFVVVGTILPDAYTRGHWFIFFAASAILILLVPVILVINRVAPREAA